MIDSNRSPAPPKLFGSMRTKILIAVGCAGVIAVGLLTLPAPMPTAVAPPEERATPLLEAEVQRREQLRMFGELQPLGPQLARHSVTIPAIAPPPGLPADVSPPTRRVGPAGHGLIVSAEGEILTSSAALQGRETLPVQLIDGTTAEARVIAFDPQTDLVLLVAAPIPRTDAAPWATEPPPPGMLAVAVAHDAGQVAVAPVFVTAAPDAERRIRTTTAELAPGTPIFTISGEVFAVVPSADEPSAVLVAPAMSRLRDRIASGQARRGALGVTFQPVEGDLAKIYPGVGVLLADVAIRGPADDADLLPGDFITAIGGTAVSSIDEAQQVIAELKPESPVTVELIRDGEPLTIEVLATSALGMRVRQSPRPPVTDAPEARALLDEDELAPNGLQGRSRILAIDGVPVVDTATARAQLRRARPPVLLYIENERGRMFRVLERAP